jgi:hypothetical protein
MLGLVLAIYRAFGPVACQNRIVNLKNRTLSCRTNDEVVNPPTIGDNAAPHLPFLFTRIIGAFVDPAEIDQTPVDLNRQGRGK